MNDSEKTFEIGLCLAGTVSAGAYTAGVIDFLIEALETWEQKRNDPNEKNVPSHRVIIKTIGGASGGGMTGIITTTLVNEEIEPIAKITPEIEKKNYNNKLYRTWVDLTNDDMFPELLNTDDLEGGKAYSLFNSDFIRKISEEALKIKKPLSAPRPYFDAQMKFFTTLSNLEGLTYQTPFQGSKKLSHYHLTRHNDYATFQLNTDEASYNKGWIPVDFLNPDNPNNEIVRQSAVATGAFPIALQTQAVTRPSKYVNDLTWLQDLTNKFQVPGETYSEVMGDGGMINNEPFLRVKELLTKPEDDYNTFRSTVLMIDPFPSEAPTNTSSTTPFELPGVIGKTLTAMLGQMRIKPELLKEILDVNKASQFQIAPRRKILVNGELTQVEGEKAAACAFLGGFGGFIHKDFRKHDFFLGRANCEQFLRERFVIPKGCTNPIFAEGYEGIDEGDFCCSKGNRQIIPIFKEKGDKYMPGFTLDNLVRSDWPTKNENHVELYKKHIRRRVEKLSRIFIKDVDSWQVRLALKSWVGMGIIKKLVTNAFFKAIKKDMISFNLLTQEDNSE